MIYTFRCECGYRRELNRSIKDGPPARVKCVDCGESMDRDWRADQPMIDTSGCKDHSDIPMQKRVASAFDRGTPAQQERRFNEHIHERRKQLADGGNRGSFRHTHSIPEALYHGKIKETGDKRYWEDPKNVERHKDCKVG